MTKTHQTGASPIPDYGNTEVEKRFLFYKPLIRLLEFGRERDTIDLSQIALTHHTLKALGKRHLALGQGQSEKIAAVSEAGSGSVHEKQMALLREIIERVNGLFTGDLTEGDQLVYVNEVIRGKLMESEVLATQALNNSKAQFAASPTLDEEMLNAVMDTLEAHQSMSRQALDSDKVRSGLKDILLGPGRLYEQLRDRAAQL